MALAGLKKILNDFERNTKLPKLFSLAIGLLIVRDNKDKDPNVELSAQQVAMFSFAFKIDERRMSKHPAKKEFMQIQEQLKELICDVKAPDKTASDVLQLLGMKNVPDDSAKMLSMLFSPTNKTNVNNFSGPNSTPQFIGFLVRLCVNSKLKEDNLKVVESLAPLFVEEEYTKSIKNLYYYTEFKSIDLVPQGFEDSLYEEHKPLIEVKPFAAIAVNMYLNESIDLETFKVLIQQLPFEEIIPNIQLIYDRIGENNKPPLSDLAIKKFSYFIDYADKNKLIKSLLHNFMLKEDCFIKLGLILGREKLVLEVLAYMFESCYFLIKDGENPGSFILSLQSGLQAILSGKYNIAKDNYFIADVSRVFVKAAIKMKGSGFAQHETITNMILRTDNLVVVSVLLTSVSVSKRMLEQVLSFCKNQDVMKAVISKANNQDVEAIIREAQNNSNNSKSELEQVLSIVDMKNTFFHAKSKDKKVNLTTFTKIYLEKKKAFSGGVIKPEDLLGAGNLLEQEIGSTQLQNQEVTTSMTAKKETLSSDTDSGSLSDVDFEIESEAPSSVQPEPKSFISRISELNSSDVSGANEIYQEFVSNISNVDSFSVGESGENKSAICKWLTLLLKGGDVKCQDFVVNFLKNKNCLAVWPQFFTANGCPQLSENYIDLLGELFDKQPTMVLEFFCSETALSLRFPFFLLRSCKIKLPLGRVTYVSEGNEKIKKYIALLSKLALTNPKVVLSLINKKHANIYFGGSGEQPLGYWLFVMALDLPQFHPAMLALVANLSKKFPLELYGFIDAIGIFTHFDKAEKNSVPLALFCINLLTCFATYEGLVSEIDEFLRGSNSKLIEHITQLNDEHPSASYKNLRLYLDVYNLYHAKIFNKVTKKKFKALFYDSKKFEQSKLYQCIRHEDIQLRTDFLVVANRVGDIAAIYHCLYQGVEDRGGVFFQNIDHRVAILGFIKNIPPSRLKEKVEALKRALDPTTSLGRLFANAKNNTRKKELESELSKAEKLLANGYSQTHFKSEEPTNNDSPEQPKKLSNTNKESSTTMSCVLQ